MMSVAYYRPVWAARSDGEREIKTKHGREFNGPTELQLNKNASEDEFFELLPVHDEVAQDWKRALGGMLQRQWKEHGKELETEKDKKWILVDFPENYRLYKHVRKDRNKTGKLAKLRDNIIMLTCTFRSLLPIWISNRP